MNKCRFLISLSFIGLMVLGGCSGVVTNEKLFDENTYEIAVGEKFTLDLADKFEGKPIKWTTENDSIAYVYNGEISAISKGYCKIMGEYQNIKTTCKVKVVENEHNTRHVQSCFDTDYDLISNGQTSYKLVLGAEENDELIAKKAANDFVALFKEATGIEIDVIRDNATRFNSEATYISLGNTKLLKEAGIKDEKKLLTQNGFKIVTKGRCVFLVGGGRFGTTYSIYEFFKHQFGYEQYAVDEIKMSRNVKDLKLKQMNIVEIPDFEWRLGNNGEYWNGGIFPQRMRMQTVEDIWIQLGGLPWHNYKATVPPSVHQASHPDWYAPDGVQLCLSRDVEGLSNEVFKQMKKYIEDNPGLSILTFTQEDVNVWCTCPLCSASKAKYGVNSATNIKFINVVAKKVKAWLEEEHPDREITIVIFAYHQVEDAPATLNAATGNYEPIDKNVVLEDNVAVMYAPIFANHYMNFSSKENSRVVETMKKWQALTDKIFLWNYSTYFVNYLMPFDAFNALQEKYIYAYENNVKYLFDQQQYNQNVGTDWYRLKEYLTSKMSWDVYQDMQVLIDDFFDNYFKEARDEMMEYFKKYRRHWAYLNDVFGVGGTIGENIRFSDYWPENVLRDWLGHLENAKQALSIHKDDPILYNKLIDRITLESISLRHLDLLLYRSSYSELEYQKLYKEFKEDCARLGVNNHNEWGAIDQLFNEF